MKKHLVLLVAAMAILSGCATYSDSSAPPSGYGLFGGDEEMEQLYR
ncbi:MAG: hypothetical protein ACI83P_002685 [Janthinobacterium sp.]|jgi:uncharacterized protein YceK